MKTPILSAEQLTEGDFYALPHEVAFMESQVRDIKSKRVILAGHIKDSMEQSSETWHDNAPADALFGELNMLDGRESKLAVAERRLTVVEYPDPDFSLVTIGTRVGCVISGSSFEIDVTGNLPLTLPADGEVETGSIAAPMPRALLGAEQEASVEADINGRIIEIGIMSVDQTTQREFYESI